ncbi:MAG: CbtA family protein [Pseudomonadota bacterium]
MPLSRSAGALNLGVFNRIVRTAAWSGILAGLLLTAVQQAQVSGIILQAEVYEQSPAQAAPPATPAASAPADRAPTVSASAGAAPTDTAPADGMPPAHHHAPGTAPHAHAHARATAQASSGHARAAAPSEATRRHSAVAASASATDSGEHAAEATTAPHTHRAAPHEHAAQGEAAHTHEHGGWQPENGFERTFFTVLANISMAVAFGLLLAAGFCLRGGALSWRAGLVWGAAGYAVFFLAPSLGLPPELPGTQAAPLAARQFWWMMTALSTAGALALLTQARNWPLRIAGVALLAAPHLIGAPQPLEHGGTAPAELARSFIYASAIANAVFWLALGGLAGWFYKKYD